MLEYSITESFLLLVHHTERKRFAISSVQLRAGLAGTLLSDLLILGLISTREDRLVTVRNAESPNGPWSDIMKELASMEKKRKPGYWIRKISRKHRKYLWDCMEKLAREQVVRIEERQFLGFFPWKQSKLIRRDKRTALVAELRSSLYSGSNPEDTTLVLLGLVQAIGAYGVLCKKWTERWEIRRRIKNLLREQTSTDLERKQFLDNLQSIFRAIKMSVASERASYPA